MPIKEILIKNTVFREKPEEPRFSPSYEAPKGSLLERLHNSHKLIQEKAFGNICSRTCAVPLQQNKNGVILVSGFNPTIASMVFSQKNDPYEVLLEKLNSTRYDAVEKALA